MSQPFDVLGGWLIPDDRVVDATVAIEEFRKTHFPQRAELKHRLFFAMTRRSVNASRYSFDSGILAGVMGLFHVFNTGVVRELVSTTTNVSPDDMFAGKWVLMNLPPAVWGDTGNFVNAGFKFITQNANLRRHSGPDSRINVIWCDEAQQFSNSFDAHYNAADFVAENRQKTLKI